MSKHNHISKMNEHFNHEKIWMTNEHEKQFTTSFGIRENAP